MPPFATSVTLLIVGETSSTRSTFDNGLVEQKDLVLVGRLKYRCPPLKVSPCHRQGCPLTQRIATFSSLDQLLQGRIEVVQFDSNPQSSRPKSFLISFNSRPVAPLQNHALALGKEVLGKNPQLSFETHSEFFIPQIGAQLRRPPVLIQPNGGDFGCEPTSECRLARGWKPTDQHEPRRWLRHARFLTRVKDLTAAVDSSHGEVHIVGGKYFVGAGAIPPPGRWDSSALACPGGLRGLNNSGSEPDQPRHSG